MLPTATENRHNIEPYLWTDQAIEAQRRRYVWTELPSGAGVYFLFRDTQLAYVGQSRHLSRRLYRHGFPERTIKPVSWLTHYAVIPTPVELLDAVESFFIWLYEPPLNERYLPLHPDAAPYLSEYPPVQAARIAQIS